MKSRYSAAGTWLLLLALAAVASSSIMLFGARLGFWEPIVGFGYARQFIAPMGYIVTGLSLLGLLILTIKRNPSGAIKAFVASVLGLALLYPTLTNLVSPPVSPPPIHDITTETNNPPEFLVLDENRPGASNSLTYGGEEVASLQKEAYPDITSIKSELPAGSAFERAISIAQFLDWDIVAQDSDMLRFEATARTPVFHFADDVVVLVTPNGDASLVDLRSVSRIGRGDRGVNAARIRTFIKAF